MIQSGPKRTFDGLIIMPDGKKVFLPSSGYLVMVLLHLMAGRLVGALYQLLHMRMVR